MTTTKKTATSPDDLSATVGAALGASIRDVGSAARNVDVLAEHYSARLISTGGRPSNPDWTLTRRVPFSESTWGKLQYLATKLGTSERTLAPAQLAASLVEERVAELDDAIKQRELPPKKTRT